MTQERIKKELKSAKKEMQLEGFKCSKESEKIATLFASNKLTMDEMVERALKNAKVDKI